MHVRFEVMRDTFVAHNALVMRNYCVNLLYVEGHFFHTPPLFREKFWVNPFGVG